VKAAEYTGRVLGNGTLEIPATVRRQLELQANSEVKVILLRPEAPPSEGTQEQADIARKRHEAIAALLALRQEFAGMDFSLTDEVVRMREEEDV
jgi:hypothetical protein